MVLKFKKIGLIFFVIASCLLLVGYAPVSADYSSSDLQSILGNSPFYYPQNADCSGSDNTTVALVGSDNEQQAFNFFVQKGLSSTQAASIIGVLMQESGMDPTIIQNGGNTNDPSTVTGALVGWGIAQWTPGDRIIQIAQSLNVTSPIYELGTQLTIVWDEMTGQSPVGQQDMAQGMGQTSSISTGVLYFLENFEDGIQSGESVSTYEQSVDYQNRVNFANQALALYGQGSANSGSTQTSSLTYNCGSISDANCASSNATLDNQAGNTTNNAALRQSVICIAEQENNTWKSQPGYPWPCPVGEDQCTNSYAESAYLKYTQNIPEEWCADFASWVYHQAGHPFSGGVGTGGWMLPGVPDIVAAGQPPNQQFTWHPASSNYTPIPGDLAIYKSPQFKYAHVNIFISSSGGVSNYIGGDQAHGPWPGGSIVSEVQGNGYYSGSGGPYALVGYVSPN